MTATIEDTKPDDNVTPKHKLYQNSVTLYLLS